MRSGSDQRPRGRYNGNRPSQQQLRPPQPQRGHTFDRHGPDVRIRGSAHQIFERYVALARETERTGDRVAAENLYQHAEHYFRIANASNGGDQQGTPPRPTTPADVMTSETEERSRDADMERSQTGWGDDRPVFL